MRTTSGCWQRTGRKTNDDVDDTPIGPKRGSLAAVAAELDVAGSMRGRSTGTRTISLKTTTTRRRMAAGTLSGKSQSGSTPCTG